jgi:membrane-bound inhibitor of C-type lysozyme
MLSGTPSSQSTIGIGSSFLQVGIRTSNLNKGSGWFETTKGVSMRKVIPGVAVALMLSGLCGLAYAQKSFRYNCDDGTQLIVVFAGMKAARLTIGARTVVLPIAMSGSGSRYADATMTFWIKGDSAMLTRGAVTTECHTR